MVRSPKLLDNETRAELDARMEREFPIYFLEMNDAQERFIRVKNRFGRTPKRRIFEAGNKVGKTHMGICEDIAHAVGYRCWLPESDPDYRVPVKTPPNIGLVACETMMHSVAEKIEPMLKLLIPKTCQPVFKPGPTGILIRVKLTLGPYGEKCGSEIHVRSYDQRPDTFEGIDFDWVHYDEPPPQNIYTAVERGKVVTNASSWFTMTPLKEPWVYDQLSLKAAVHV